LTVFEFLLALYAIVAGLGVSLLVRSVGQMIEARDRVRLYWVHGCWIALIFVGLRWSKWRDAIRLTVLARMPVTAREFVTRWNSHGPAHHCAVGVGHLGGTIDKLGALLGLPVARVC